MSEKKITLHDIVGISDSVKIGARTDLADIYIKEAERQFIRTRDAHGISLNPKDDDDEQNKAVWNEEQGSLFTILLSVFALEAHINRIGHDRLETDWKKLERLSLKQKWIDFPQMISKKTFDQSTQLFRDFQKIIELRNQLVHFKDYDFKELVNHPCGNKVTGIYEILNVKNAELAFNTAKDMMKELNILLK